MSGDAAGARDPFSLRRKIRLTLTKDVPGGQNPNAGRTVACAPPVRHSGLRSTVCGAGH